MKTWARWLTGAAAAASLASAPALAQDYNSYPGAAPPPGQGAYAPQPPEQQQYDQGQGDLDFRGTLSPYGEWIDVPGVGEVWRPYDRVVGTDFQPYSTGGHWVYTDYGWTWQSDYPWGWAPFHYGRWVYRSRWGWLWRAGREWGPAWVEWRQGGGYVGWAPMRPEGVEWIEPVSRPSWCFVETSNLVSPRLSYTILRPERVRMVFNSTMPLREQRTYGRWSFYAGPPIAHVATAVGHPIAPVSVSPGHFGWREHPVAGTSRRRLATGTTGARSAGMTAARTGMTAATGARIAGMTVARTGMTAATGGRIGARSVTTRGPGTGRRLRPRATRSIGAGSRCSSPRLRRRTSATRSVARRSTRRSTRRSATTATTTSAERA
jgi:uncharacterized protein DUF6600